jgi:Flp pilus assembly protein CpaB
VTLEVDPQDALVLKYARETGAQLDLALRAAGDKDSKFSTEAVTLQYMFERFKVAVPPKLDYGIGGAGGVPVGASAPQ